MSDSNSAIQKSHKRQVLRPQKPIWKSWHILVQKPQIDKLMSDSCSAALRPRKPLETYFYEKKIFQKKIIFFVADLERMKNFSELVLQREQISFAIMAPIPNGPNSERMPFCGQGVRDKSGAFRILAYSWARWPHNCTIKNF